MKKTICILLKKNHLKLGSKGSIKNVARGYALNYLLPQNLAEIPTKKKIRHMQMFEEIKNKKTEANKKISYQVQKRLNNITTINLTRKKGEKNLIFGSISEKDIIYCIHKQTGIKLDKKQINISSIKQLGSFEIKINILDNMYSKIQLNILPNNI